MNLVFLAANCSYSHTSLAAWCLRAALPPGLCNWRTVEVTVKDDPASVVDQILESHPLVVAATLYLFNHDFVIDLLARVRAREPDCLIVVGGPQCRGDNRSLVIPGGVADLAVRGDGEAALAELLQRITAGGGWDDIRGLCGCGGNGDYFDNGFAEDLTDLDSVPSFYSRELAGFIKPFIQVETSRGCSNGCLFCTSRETPVKTRSLDRVRVDLHAIEEAGVREVRIVDRTFNEDRVRAIELVSLFRDEFPGLRFHLEIDPARFGEALANELAKSKSGQFHVEAGIQSLDPSVYAAIERKATMSRTLEGLRRLCSVPTIEVHVDLIAGLPKGTLGSLLQDIKTIIALEPAEIQVERLKLLPGTPLAATPLAWGLEGSSTPPYQVLSTPVMTADDLSRADQLSKVIDWFYNQESLRDIMSGAVQAIPDFLDQFTRRVQDRVGFGTCPNLEDRFVLLDGMLAGPLQDRLRYQWYRLGFSTRNGPCPSRSWKAAIPDEAVLIDGDVMIRVSRKVRVELSTPHIFCYGTGPHGERSVVAVYRV